MMCRLAAVACCVSVVLLVGSVACLEPDHIDEPDEMKLQDSEGVQIVEATSPTWSEADVWRVDTVPVVDLTRSGSGVAHEFFRVRGMRRLSDRSIVVVDRGSNEVRLYSNEGNFITAAGGTGDAAGEFRNIRLVENVGDTLLALDASGRVTVLDPRLAVLRVFDLPQGASTIHHLAGNEVMVQFIYPTMALYGRNRGLIRQPGRLYRYDTMGQFIDSIASTAGIEEYMSISENGGRTASRPLFGRSAHIAADGQRIFHGAANDMQVEELDVTGRTVRILRMLGFPLDLTRDQVRAEREAYFQADLPPGVAELPAFLRQLIEELPTPTRRPAYGDLLLDPSGVLWLKPFFGRSETGVDEVWQVIDSEGTWLGGVSVPANFTIMDVQMDVLLGVWRDELQIEHPRALRLHRQGK